MTEKEKMLAGEVYSAVDPELIKELMTTREVLYEYNSLRPSETQRMKEILKGLFGHVADDDFLINQPFRCDYGKQISIGKRFFANFNFTVLDEARVTIGDSPLAMTVLSAPMSAYTPPVTVLILWSATPVRNGQNLFLSVIMYGLEVA